MKKEGIEEFKSLFRRCNPSNIEEIRIILSKALRLGIYPSFFRKGCFYKIRNFEGLVSDGGYSNIEWVKEEEGFQWNSYAELKEYLTKFTKLRLSVQDTYKNCSVVEYQVVLSSSQDVGEFFNALIEERRKKEKEKRIALEKKQKKVDLITSMTQDIHSQFMNSEFSEEDIKEIFSSISNRIKDKK